MTLLNTTKSYRALDRIMAIVLKIVTFLVVVSILTAVAISATSCSNEYYDIHTRLNGEPHASLDYDDAELQAIFHEEDDYGTDYTGVAWRKSDARMAENKALRESVVKKIADLKDISEAPYVPGLEDKLEEEYRYLKLLFINDALKAKNTTIHSWRNTALTCEEHKSQIRYALIDNRKLNGKKFFKVVSDYPCDSCSLFQKLTNNTDHTHVSPRQYSTYRLWERKEYKLKLKALEHLEIYGGIYNGRSRQIDNLEEQLYNNDLGIAISMDILKPKIDAMECPKGKKKKKK